VHETLNFEELPKVETEDAKSDLDTLYCTAYGCQGQIAMCFCITCGDKFCTGHQKVIIFKYNGGQSFVCHCMVYTYSFGANL